MSQLTTKRQARLADLGLFYAAAIWGSTFFVVKGVLSEIHPVILVGQRFTLAGLVLLGYLLMRRRPVLAHWREGCVLAVLLWLIYIPQTVGLGITTASNSGFITGLFVAFVPLFLRLIFKRKPKMMEVIASVVSLLGLWVLTGGLTKVNTGDVLTLGTAMACALHLIYVDRFMKRGLDPLIITCQQFLLVGLFSLLAGWIFNLPFTFGSPAAMGTVVFLALFPSLSAFVIQLKAQKIVSPLRVSLIFSLEPVFAGVFAWTLGGEQFVLSGAIGGLLIALALALAGLPGPRRKR